MRVRMKVEGGDLLARKLQMLAEETAKEHMREATLAGAELVRVEAERLAPRPHWHPGQRHPCRCGKANKS